MHLMDSGKVDGPHNGIKSFLKDHKVCFKKTATECMGMGATVTKASKAQALPKFWVTVNPISTKGANYVHHSTMGLV